MRAVSSIYISEGIKDLNINNGFLSFKDGLKSDADLRILVLIKRKIFQLELVSKMEFLFNHYSEKEGFILAVLKSEDIDPYLLRLTKSSIREGYGSDIVSFLMKNLEKERS